MVPTDWIVQRHLMYWCDTPFRSNDHVFYSYSARPSSVSSLIDSDQRACYEDTLFVELYEYHERTPIVSSVIIWAKPNRCFALKDVSCSVSRQIEKNPPLFKCHTGHIRSTVTVSHMWRKWFWYKTTLIKFSHGLLTIHTGAFYRCGGFTRWG